MIHSPLLPHLQLADIEHIDANQAIVFAFVIIIIAIANLRRIKQQKMWHETVRQAIDKGQPLPATMAYGGPFGRSFRYRGLWPLYRGLVLIAVGIGFYLVHSQWANRWAPLPICIGAALLLIGLFNCFRSPDNSDPQNPQNPANRL